MSATVVGILNLTPDSFFDGGQYIKADAACRRIDALIQAGATLIDIGAESTRPGAVPVDTDTEWSRLAPVLSVYRKQFAIPFSVDTMKARIAKQALEYGAAYINDVSGFRNAPDMADTIRAYKAGVILTHSIGTPETMQDNPVYTNGIADIITGLQACIQQATGIHPIIIDPGIGFGKTAAHNALIMRHLDAFIDLGYPVMLGVSRKSFISSITGPDQTLAGSLAATVYAYQQGVRFFRVHDVAETVAALRVSEVVCPTV